MVVYAVRYERVSNLQFPANREINREFRDSGPSEANFVHETTVLQRLFTKFPTQINRENILKNREFLSGNREFHCKVVSVHFLHACFLADRTRSVLTDKF